MPSSSLESGSSDEGSDTEHEFAMAILNQETYQTDLKDLTSEEEITLEVEEADRAAVMVTKVKNLEENARDCWWNL